MKNYNKILEAIDRGILLALDDYDDTITSKKLGSYKEISTTKEYLDLMNEVVDLGLPSGTLWGKYNLGVNPNQLIKPEDWYGNYYAWGEVEPKHNKKANWKNYKFVKELDYRNKPIFTKYITKYEKDHGLDISYLDNLTSLLPEDDAAYQYDNRMKMPSDELFDELVDNLTGEWKLGYNGIKGLNGMLYKSENGNEIFFPAAGCITLDGNGVIGQSACLYTNKISPLNLKARYAEMWGGQFGSNDTVTDADGFRYRALSIRPILNIR